MGTVGPRIVVKARGLLLLAAIAIALCLSEFLVRVVPFRIYARWLLRPPTGPVAPLGLVRSVRRKIFLAARLLPWRPACLAQALAGRMILSAGGYATVLTLGTRDHDGELAAHAWLKSGDWFICGKEEFAKYAVVAEF